MIVTPTPLTSEAFAKFGDVLEAKGTPDKMINRARCGRFHDRANLDFGPDGRAGISIFLSEVAKLPLEVDMVERHPEGTQAFISMSGDPFLVIVAEDNNGTPFKLRAFIAEEGQGINLHRGIWHGVLTPLHEPGLFAVVDRIGDTANLEEHWFDKPYVVRA